MLKIIAKFFTVFFLVKKVFFRPKKKYYVLFNKGSKVLTFLLKKNYQLLPTLKQEINLYVLFKIILKLKFTTLDYYKEYISIIQPRKVITFIDNDLVFYKIKFFFKNIFFISIQNGLRTNSKLCLKENRNKLFCDLICLIGKQEQKFYKSVKTKFVVTGSVLNNNIYKNFNMLDNKKRVIVFVSEYRVYENYLFTDKTIQKIYDDNEVVLLPILADFCKKNNYKLVIAGCFYKNSHESYKEYTFYKSILNKFTNLNWNFLTKKNFFTNYYFLNKISLLVSFGSTLGLEAFSRKVKVLRFQRQTDSRCGNFWIYNKKKGPCLVNNFDKKNVFNKINKILHDDSGINVEYYNNIKLSYLIRFDPDNRYLKKIIV